MDPVDALLKALGAVDLPRVRAWLAALAERDAPAELTAEDMVLVRDVGVLGGDAVAAAEWRACAEERLVFQAVVAIPPMWRRAGDPGAALSAAATAAAAVAVTGTCLAPHAAATAAAATPQLPKPLCAVALAVCLVLPPDVKASAVEGEELLVRWLGGSAVAATRHVKAARRWAAAHSTAILASVLPSLRGPSVAALVSELAGGSGTGPLLALVAPGEPLGSLALLPHAVVVDTYCHHAPGAADAALSSLARAELHSPPDVVATSSPLRIAFQDAAARHAALVRLDDRLLQPVTMAALSTDFIDAIGSTDGRGVPWAQPGRNVVGSNTLWSSTSRDCRAPSMKLVYDAAHALARASNAARRPVVVLLPRWGTYAQSHYDAGGEIAFCRPDGSADTAYPALAEVFIATLASACTYHTQVVVLTDDVMLARSPADAWLTGIISRARVVYPNEIAPRTVFVTEAALIDMLQGPWVHCVRLADRVQLRHHGGGSVPFIAAPAGEPVGAVPAAAAAAAASEPGTWKEASTNLIALRHAGLQLLYDNLPAAVLDAAASDTAFIAAYRHLCGDTGWGGAGGDYYDDYGALNAGPAVALHFAMGSLRTDWLWLLVHGETLAALEAALVKRVLPQRKPVMCLTLEHAERSGGSVAVAQFAWECYARHGLAVARLDPAAVHRLADVCTAASAARAVQLAACIAAGIPVVEADTGSAVYDDGAAPVLVLLVDYSEQPSLETLVARVATPLQAGSNMRVIVLRTRRVAASSSDAAASPLEVVVQLRSPSDTESTAIRACQLDVAQLLSPLTPRDELQRQLDGASADRASSARLFRRLRGMLTVGRLGAGSDVAAALAQRAMYSWAVDALRRVYAAAAREPRRVAGLRAFLFAALVHWCGGTGGVSYATLAAVVHNSSQQRWVFALAAEAEEVVINEARACVVEQLEARSGERTALAQSGRLLLFAPAAAWQGAVAACGDPPVLAGVGVGAHLRGVVTSAVDAARGAAAAAPGPMPHASLSLPTGVPTAGEAEAAVREALSPPGVGNDIWTEVVRTDVDGRLAFISRDAAALLLSVALGFEAARCPPAAKTQAGGAAGLHAVPPIIEDVWADDAALPSVEPPPVGVFALAVCLLQALVRDAGALRSVQAVGNDDDDDDELATRRLGGQLVWEASAVFKRHSPAIDLLLGASRVVDAATVFSSHACRLLTLATAVWSQRWRLVADTAQFLCGSMDAISAAAAHDGAAAAASAAAVNAAVLFAASSGLATTALSLLSEGAGVRMVDTHDMLGVAHLRLLSTGMPVRVQAVRDAAGAAGLEGAVTEAATQLADAFVVANEARRWYRFYAAPGDEMAGPKMQQMAHEADLWLTVLEGAAGIAAVLREGGHVGTEAAAAAGEPPLASEATITDAIKHAVATSVVLRDAYLDLVDRYVDHVATLPAAAARAGDLLRQLGDALAAAERPPRESARYVTMLLMDTARRDLIVRWLAVAGTGAGTRSSPPAE